MYQDLERTLYGYMRCALGSTNDETTPSGGEPLDRNYDVYDIVAETKNKMRSDCNLFLEVAEPWLEKIPDLDFELVGHDLWLTRNGHGAGFWDSPEKWGGDENAETLSKIAKAMGERGLYAENGWVYQEIG